MLKTNENGNLLNGSGYNITTYPVQTETSPFGAKLASALLKAQKKMVSATKDSSNPYFKSKYADYGAVLEVVKGPLNDEGFSILQPVSSDSTGHYVETVIVHESGEYYSSGAMRLELAKTDMQALGSAITYARRYQLQSLLGVPAEDDDGESSMKRDTSVKSVAEATANVETKKATSSFKRPTPPASTSSTGDNW